ncbi:sodium/proline symporter PutP [Clostridiaceae bacterium M8S5]|nr:sodium/proline symporter PutP [Clostridiaceae bacterium M8S5]
MAVSGSIIFTFTLYLLGMLAIGMHFYKKTTSLSEYILGGRGLNSWVAAMSASASDMSGWLLMGLPGAAYLSGLEASWIAIGLAIGTYLNWRFVAKRLRKYTEISNNSITLPDYFENRFKDNTRILRMVSAFFIVVFFLVYTASGFVAGAKLFNAVFNLPYMWALVIGIVVIIGYTFLGGFMAVSFTDFIQGILMFIAIIAVPLVAIITLGGFTDTISSVKEVNPELLNLFTKTDGTKLTFLSIISLAAWGIGYFGQPHILVRFMAIKSSEKVKKARIIATTWSVISLGAAVLIGMIGIVYLKTPLEGAGSETVFMVMVNALFHPLVAGIFLAAILAAVMSTADSQLLVTSSSFTKDFYQVVFRKKATEKELVLISRIAVVIIAFIAFLIATNPDSSVLGLVSYAWAGLGASFGPVVLISIYWKRMTRNSAIAGMVVGGLTVIIWKHLEGGLFDVYEILPAFIFASIAIFIVSILGKKPSKKIQEEFENAIKAKV